MELQRIRDDLVLAALPNTAFDGWSASSLAEAGRDLGLAADAVTRAFPRGPIEAVEHFVRLADRTMAAELAALDLESMRVGQRVTTAVKLRLEHWAGHREAIRRALALLSLPYNLPLAARLTWNTADAIWVAIGDSAHDFSWYTKRSTLAAVYSATLLYWLEDESEGSADTWAFLSRRLGDIRRLPELRTKVEGLFGKVPLRFGAAPARRWGMQNR
jgi:ubiquinone biosynthesis protein COQ9